MTTKPGLNPRTIVLALAVGALELSIVALWLLDDAVITAWLR